jgi:SAM-dependent methyltransferase
MNPQTVAALLALNRQFYSRFAGEFSRTRRSWPPGYSRILPHLESGFNVLDLGCGNGRLLLFLGESGWTGRYVGVDSSDSLLDDARTIANGRPEIRSRFIEADLLAEDWTDGVRQAGPFDALIPVESIASPSWPAARGCCRQARRSSCQPGSL